MVICGLTYKFSGRKNAMPMDIHMKSYGLGIVTLFVSQDYVQLDNHLIGLGKSLRG